jgi:hypothetical protein
MNCVVKLSHFLRRVVVKNFRFWKTVLTLGKGMKLALWVKLDEIYFYPEDRRQFRCMAATDLEFGSLDIS